ncbi:F-actin-uncapping protein LRRC16A [Agrilus planipennis]|uniref:F-actin-uncapping protein LRRC16A n=1 Tax=Agrilus planipennis TaxID=224129 RepID=A0A1W4XN46_AGRPL|nr:F-actin-uncapping protein LRRC16A [Agrilus planipennis]
MSTKSQLTKDLNESIKRLLGKQVKILFKNVVRLETKGDKTENRVMVFSPCRILLLTAKVPTRIDFHFHYLEIQAVESKRGNQLSITVNDKTHSFLTGEDSTCSLEVDNMISAIATALRNIFPTVPLNYIIKKIEVLPATRLQQLYDLEIISRNQEVGPCGGFSTQYACMCDYHNMTYRDEVAWDIDNILVCLNNRELCLKDFDHLDQRDLVPIISALEYNTWFTKIRAAHVKLSHECSDRILHLIKNSLCLEELYLDNLGIKADYVNKISHAIKSNTESHIHTIDLSNNPLEDKGLTYLCGWVSNLKKGIEHLNLSHCGATSKGVNHLTQSLCSNEINYTTLSYLNLCGNSLKDDIQNLSTFLSHPNSLTHLDLSSTDIVIDSLFNSLAKGCTTNLIHLNVSRNTFSCKKNKEPPISFKQFFTASMNLKYINMSHCKLPQEALKNLLLGLACNEFIKDMSLDLSSNSLGGQGAHVLESCVHGVRCISSLDISDNNMDVDLAEVILAINRNKSLKHLSLARNMCNMKAKHVSVIMDAIVQIIQDEECVLQTLNLSESRLKSDLHNFLNALGDNKCLEKIDISGNLIGDTGARLLAKALQINKKLVTIILDRNNITLPGYSDIAYALECNYSLQYMPFPIYDVGISMKASAEKTDFVMRKIQDSLNRNSAPKNSNKKNLFLSHSDFVLNSKQHIVARLLSKAREALRNAPTDSLSSEEIAHAKDVIEEAENAKQILENLQDVAHRRKNPEIVDTKMKQVVCEIHNSISESLQETMDIMLKSCKELYPSILKNANTIKSIKRECKKKNQIPVDFVNNIIKVQAGSEIITKIRNANHLLALCLSEQVIEEVQDALMKSYKTLIGDNRQMESPLLGSRNSSSDSSRHGTSDLSITDDSRHYNNSSVQLEYLNLATPHLSNKRKSLHGRKLKIRPKSMIGSSEGLSADDISDLIPSLPHDGEEEDSVTELPNATHQLQHLVKGRPRRVKTKAPTRPLIKPDSGENQDLSEGLETFFRPGSVTPTSDDCSSFQSASPNHELASPVMNEDQKTPKFQKTSLFFRGLTNSRSRSTDNLGKYSPLLLHKSTSDISSPARRLTGDSLISRKNNNKAKEISNGNKCPSGKNSFQSSLEKNDESNGSSLKTNQFLVTKPRPWSMVNAEQRNDNLLSDGSSPINSTENTPDSGEALDCSELPSLGRRTSQDSRK